MGYGTLAFKFSFGSLTKGMLVFLESHSVLDIENLTFKSQQKQLLWMIHYNR